MNNLNRRGAALMLLVILSLTLLITANTGAANGPVSTAPPGFRPTRADAAQWHELYWRWAFGDFSPATDRHGNAVVFNTVLMALPNVPGDGAPGSIDITLDAGQSFFLPLIGVFGTSYTDGTPPDPFVDISIFEDMTFNLSVDGVTIGNEANILDFYAQAHFANAIALNSPPLDSIIYFQSLGILHHPLPPGTHVIQLDETQTVPVFGYTAEYHNTFNVTVVPRGR